MAGGREGGFFNIYLFPMEGKRGEEKRPGATRWRPTLVQVLLVANARDAKKVE